MPHAAPTSIAPTDPAAFLPAPPDAAKSRGNPNRALAPAPPARGLGPRGARTHAGCLCRSPAIHGKLRCRMHGGRSPGPRTPEGCIRVRDARTIHGNHGANVRAENRYRLTLPRIGRVGIALDRYQTHLPLAPSANRPPQGAPTPGSTAPFKPYRTDPLNREPTAKPGTTVPFKQFRTDPLNREPTAQLGSTTPFKPFRTGPLNREPTAKPGATARFKPFRTDPLNREPAVKTGATVPFKPFRTDPLNREPTAQPGSTVPFKPFRTDPLNREPTAKTRATAPRVAGSNGSSAATTAQPDRAHDPAPRPGQSGEASKVRAAPRPCLLHRIALPLHAGFWSGGAETHTVAGGNKLSSAGRP